MTVSFEEELYHVEPVSRNAGLCNILLTFWNSVWTVCVPRAATFRSSQSSTRCAGRYVAFDSYSKNWQLS